MLKRYYQQFYHPVYRHIYMMLKHQGEHRTSKAEELAQDTFLALHLELEKGDFESEKHVRNWLYKVASHKTKNENRGWGRWLGFLQKFKREQSSQPTEARDLHVEHHGSHEEIEAKRRHLREQLREFFSDHDLEILLLEAEGFRGVEIAQVLDLPKATVWKRLHRAHKRLLKHQELTAPGDDRDPTEATEPALPSKQKRSS